MKWALVPKVGRAEDKQAPRRDDRGPDYLPTLGTRAHLIPGFTDTTWRC